VQPCPGRYPPVSSRSRPGHASYGRNGTLIPTSFASRGATINFMAEYTTGRHGKRNELHKIQVPSSRTRAHGRFPPPRNEPSSHEIAWQRNPPAANHRARGLPVITNGWWWSTLPDPTRRDAIARLNGTSSGIVHCDDAGAASPTLRRALCSDGAYMIHRRRGPRRLGCWLAPVALRSPPHPPPADSVRRDPIGSAAPQCCILSILRGIELLPASSAHAATHATGVRVCFVYPTSGSKA
jgi:hypothetical protein